MQSSSEFEIHTIGLGLGASKLSEIVTSIFTYSNIRALSSKITWYFCFLLALISSPLDPLINLNFDKSVIF